MIYLLIGYMWLFIHRPFEIWPILATIHLERMCAILCVCYWLLLHPHKTWVNNRINFAFAFFWLVLLIAWLASPFPEAGQRLFEDYYKYIVFYILLMGTARTERDLKILTLGYLVVMGLYMTHSFREFLCGRHVYRMGIPRLIGVDQTFNDPNTFAATILYSLPLTLAFWPEAKTRWQRRALYYYSGLTVVCVILTGSRSGFVVMLVYGLIAARSLFFRNRRLILLLPLALPVAWALVPENLKDRFMTIIDSSKGPENAKGSAEGRTEGFLDGIGLWGRSPAFGIGPGAFGQATGKGFQAHNLYGQILGETGTLGALAFLGLLTCYMLNRREVRRLQREDESDLGRFPSDLSNAVLISVTLLLIKGWGDHNLYRYTLVWFGGFQAIAVRCMRERVSNAHCAQAELPASPS